MNGEDNSRKFLVEEYRSRINRVIDYIEANIDRDLSLRELAKVAHFSPYHFHRIFRAVVGETLNDFTQRIRIEKAASKLIASPGKPITEIALEYGFSNSSAFARSFRETYKMSASEWRSGGYRQHGKNGITDGKNSQLNSNFRQDFRVYPQYTQDKSVIIWRVEMKDKGIQTRIEVEDIPEMHVAYIRHIGPYKGDTELFGRLFNRLMTWAGPRGLLRFPETKMLTIYYDDPELTDESNLRTDACITVPEDTEVDGEIGKTTIPGGKYAVAHFELGPDRYQDAWDAVYRGWLPESGYQPQDGPCFEIYPGDPSSYSGNKHLVDIYVPVRPL